MRLVWRRWQAQPVPGAIGAKDLAHRPRGGITLLTLGLNQQPSSMRHVSISEELEMTIRLGRSGKVIRSGVRHAVGMGSP